MATIAYALGKDAKAYIEGATAGWANTTELIAISSGKVTIETAEADTSTREGAGWGSSTPTIRKATVELTAKMKVVDAVLSKIEAAAVDGGILEAAFLSGAKSVAGSRGPYGHWMIASFGRGEELEGVAEVSITFKLQQYLGYALAGTDPTA